MSIRAAGGVVTRTGVGDGTEVLVAHRPKYEDWSFPKGKVDPGESDEDCALREVEEETGLRCTLGDELPTTAYLDRKGRSKTVRYWAMTVLDGSFRPNDEVDETRWLAPDLAARLLSYDRDRDVLAASLELGLDAP